MPLILPNTIENDTAADAAELQQNFSTIQSHTNTNLVNRDGSVAMTGALLLPGDPTLANHASNKAYVDNKVIDTAHIADGAVTVTKTSHTRVGCQLQVTVDEPVIDSTPRTLTWDTETVDTHGFITAPSMTVTIPTGQDGLYAITVSGIFTTSWTALELTTHAIYITAGGIDYVAPYAPAFAQFSQSIIQRLGAGNTIQVTHYQNSGATRTLNQAYLTVERIDPH